MRINKDAKRVAYIALLHYTVYSLDLMKIVGNNGGFTDGKDLDSIGFH